MKNNRYCAFFLAIILFFSVFSVSCTNNINEPTYNQSQVFGMGDVFLGTNESLEDIVKRIDLMKDLGVKSHRFWFRAGSNGYDNKESFFSLKDNQLVINNDFVQRVNFVVDKLLEAGVEHITFDVCWMYGMTANGQYKYYGAGIPLMTSSDYLPFMEIIKYQFSIISKTFPEIEYFEMGNEMNILELRDADDNILPYTELAKLVTDFSYYAMQGIKEGNPNAKGVLNGLAETSFRYDEAFKKVRYSTKGGAEVVAEFIDLIYQYIESEEYPSCASIKSKRIEDYFDVLAWHPYGAYSSEVWKDYNDTVYATVKKHNDNGRPVFCTEFGFQRNDQFRGEEYVNIYSNISETPYIEVVHIFILSNVVWNEENFYLTKRDENGDYILSEAYIELKNRFGNM